MADLSPEDARRAALEVAPPPTSPLRAALVDSLRRSAVAPADKWKVLGGKEVPARSVAEAFIDQQIGTGNIPLNDVSGRRDRAAIPRPTYETSLHARAQTRVKEVYDFVESGVVTENIRLEILRLLNSDPGYKALLREVNPSIDADMAGYATGVPIPANLANMLNSIANNPEYHAKIKEHLKNTIKIDAPLPDEAADARQKAQQLRDEQTRLTADLATGGRLETEEARIKADLDEYRTRLVPGTPPTLAKGVAYQRIEELSEQIGKKQGEIAGLQAINRPLTANAATLAANITIVEGNNVNIAQFNAEKEALESERKALQDEHKALQQESKQIQAEIAAARKRITELPALVAQEESKTGPHEGTRRLKELELTENLNGIFQDAAAAYLNERVGRVAANSQEVLNEAAKRQGDAISRIIADQNRERYLERAGSKFRLSFARDLRGENMFFTNERKIDRRRVDADMNLYRAEGARGIVTDMIGAEITNQVRAKHGLAVGAPLTVDAQREIGERIDEETEKNKDQLVTNLLVNRLRVGTVPSLDDARLIQLYNPGILSTAVGRNNELRTEINKLVGEGGIDDLTRAPRGVVRHALMIFLAALGFGVAGLFSEDRAH